MQNILIPAKKIVLWEGYLNTFLGMGEDVAGI